MKKSNSEELSFMDIKQLTYFLVLCEQEHMSGTANALGISQPALSKNIANLEKELGAQLFDRHSNSIKLNDNGRIFAGYAKHAVEDLKRGVMLFKQSQYDVSGEIRIICHAFTDCITDLILAYTELNPKVKFVIAQSHAEDSQLLERYDFLLSPQGESSFLQGGELNWNPLPLFTETYEVFISPRYREYPDSITAFSMEELKEETFIDMSSISIFYADITHRLAHTAHYIPKIFCTTEDFMTKMRFVDAGKAICILPTCCSRMAKRIAPDIRQFSIKNANTTRTVCLMRKKKTQMTETALDFWDFVQDYYDTVDNSTK